MQQHKTTGNFIYSPTDLIRFMESPYAVWMERWKLAFPGELTPNQPTEEQALVAKTGDLHEAKFLAELKAEGKDIVEIEKNAKDAESLTQRAIMNGAEVIYQGCLSLEPFRGYTDFLVKAGTDAKGNNLYEVWDTKLARKPKPYFLVQLCCYAEMLAKIQGSLPTTLRVVLGSNEKVEYRTARFFSYYLQLKSAFLEMMEQFDPANPPIPDPRADHGRWASHAAKYVLEHDHLVQVAGITSGQIKKLNAAGVKTLEELAASRGLKVSKLPDTILERLVGQAALQLETRKLRQKAANGEFVRPLFKLLPIDPECPRRGLTTLPPPSANDVFFDMEGFPLVDGGLEYLFGASYRGSNGALEFKDWWAHTLEEEKLALEGFIDWAHARWIADKGMHVYHYAAYEVSAVRRLMGKHGTRENQVDDLLRNHVFVDLYQVVKQGMQVGEESYSIKYVEHLYRGQRSGDVANAGQSIVYYANWKESGEPGDWTKSERLRQIRDYNKDDCESTVQLYDWLRERQVEAEIRYLHPLAKAEEEKALEEPEHVILSRKLELKILKETDPKKKRIHILMQHLLGFYRREAKPFWWRMFERTAAEPNELKEDMECIGDAELSLEPPEPEKKSLLFKYKFDSNQDTKLKAGDKVALIQNTLATVELFSLEREKKGGEGEFQIKISAKALNEKFDGAMPMRTSLIPMNNVAPGAKAVALEAVVSAWESSEVLPPALERYVHRLPPLTDGTAFPLSKDCDVVEGAVRCAQAMKGSVLCLQGPPGTGKTYTAAHMIKSLLDSGKSVGISATSHKAIENLLNQCAELQGTDFSAIKVGGTSEGLHDSVLHLDPVKANDQYSGGLIAGTAWLFARPEWNQRLDCLFIDEAGQVSLADLAAMSVSAENLVLMGDQLQLEQPIQGSHPGESGQSALNYYLQQHATIPDELGIFLPTTRRLHPEICNFISGMVYEGRLQSAPNTAAHNLSFDGTAPRKWVNQTAGIVFSPVIHEGNVQSSEEEADRICEIIEELLSATCDGKNSKLKQEDILVVAPYNMQVRLLTERLPGVKVGSVDKFQGQEAEVVILSMCASFGEYGSRGLGFILDQNRINVALSRARTLTIVVGDPRIATSPAGSLADMQRLNLYCRLVQEYSASSKSYE